MELVDKEMTLTEHLEELRKCLIVSLLAVLIGTGIVWAWSGDFLSWLARPTGGLIFVAPAEAFYTRLKVSVFGGFLLMLPVVLHQAWSFTACALGPEVRKGIALVIPVSYVLFLAGTGLAVTAVVPAAVSFLAGYGTADIRPMLAVGNYLEFVVGLSVAFGLVFQIPVVLLFLERAGIVSRGALVHKRRFVYFAAFVVAALLTPPDVVSQLFLAFPIIALFELSIFFMRRGPA